MQNQSDFSMTRQAITATLVAAGFAIVRVRSMPDGAEFTCERKDLLGARVRYLLAFRTGQPTADDTSSLRRLADQEHAVLAIVTEVDSDDCIGWRQFASALGGVVPSWRALDSGFPGALQALSQNQVPPGMKGEAWSLFEQAVADALEFVFGRRVRRLGALQRGRSVSDLVTITPDDRVLVVDAKSSAEPFVVGEPQLRPLREYAERQKSRQLGQLPVGAVVVVGDRFQQDASRLSELARSFLADVGVALTFLPVSVLVSMLGRLTARPDLRNAIRWSRLLCGGGLVADQSLEDECRAVDAERVSRGG